MNRSAQQTPFGTGITSNQRIRDIITSLLNQIPSIFSHIKNPEPALLPTLNAALSALRATGGKIVCSLASLPTWGPGSLVMREDPKVHGTDAEKKLFTTEHAGWKKTAGKLAEAGIGVDFFIAAPGGSYMDIATIGRWSLLYCRRVANLESRARLGRYWRGDILLSQLPCPSRSSQTVARAGKHCPA